MFLMLTLVFLSFLPSVLLCNTPLSYLPGWQSHRHTLLTAIYAAHASWWGQYQHAPDTPGSLGSHQPSVVAAVLTVAQQVAPHLLLPSQGGEYGGSPSLPYLPLPPTITTSAVTDSSV
jgi:hypothetical protein